MVSILRCVARGKGCHKFMLWEGGGIRTPYMVSWPAHVPQNETRSQMVISTDWLPTIAGYC